MIPQTWKANLNKIFECEPNIAQLNTIIISLLDYMHMKGWRGACHESCGVIYVLLNELDIPCNWRLGEVTYKNETKEGRPIIFDHSWINFNDKKIDLAIFRPLVKGLEMPPIIMDLTIDNLSESELNYDINSGWVDSPQTTFVKNTPLSKYFDNSPLHPTLGTWSLILDIGKKLGLQLDINVLRKKYNGIFWE